MKFIATQHGGKRHLSLASVVVLALFVAACTNADYQLYVRNDSSQPWLIRTDEGDGSGTPTVVIVQPGTEGLAVYWVGPREHEIEVLTSDCTLVGTFEFTVDDHVKVPGVDGVDGSVQPFDVNGDWNVTGITPISACGGSVSV